MKINVFASILLSALFYAAWMSAMFVMPLVPAARYDAGMAKPDRQARQEERSRSAVVMEPAQRDLRRPRRDAAGDAPEQASMDRSVPDAAMIQPVRARAKTIKL